MTSADASSRADGATRDVELPDRILSRVEARLPRSEFDTEAEYITFVMEEVLAIVEAETDDEVDAAEQAEVERRLESLGYMES